MAHRKTIFIVMNFDFLPARKIAKAFLIDNPVRTVYIVE